MHIVNKTQQARGAKAVRANPKGRKVAEHEKLYDVYGRKIFCE